MESSVSVLDYLLQHVASTMHRQSDQVLSERLGIGMSQFKILRILQQEPGIQQRVLADRLGQTEAGVSRQIKLLVGKGLLLVEVNPESRREHLTLLTAKGTKITDAAQEVVLEYHGPVFEQFNQKQQKQLCELLESIHDAACVQGRPHTCDHALKNTVEQAA